MAKTQTKFVCQECGTWHNKWVGKCEGCTAWNTLVEEVVLKPLGNTQIAKDSAIDFVDFSGTHAEVNRMCTTISEFDRVCGGGLVPGSAILIGGDPGIGKSTLLLQLSEKLSQKDYKCYYISGEESVDQIRLRAKRLGLGHQQSTLASTSNVKELLLQLDKIQKSEAIHCLIIDSIQTMFSSDVESAPGSVSQVRSCTFELIDYAKRNGTCLILVGHVTKDGSIAGPRVLEHMVDTVLYFEGERHYQYRILRAIKNRFGPTDEIGIFSMEQQGLVEIENPSEMFLSDSEQDLQGTAIYAGMEGTRPLLGEIQALVAPSYLPTPRRNAVGFDTGRLNMLIAVLESHGGLKLGNKEIYVNVTGGLKIQEPAADLAVIAAIYSAAYKKSLPKRSIFMGEVGLSGEIRDVSHREHRLKECQKLGFEKIFSASQKNQKTQHSGSPIVMVRSILDLFKQLKLKA